jgi:hypothetical protein
LFESDRNVCFAWGSIILAADGSLSLKVKSCGSDHVITEAQNCGGLWICGAHSANIVKPLRNLWMTNVYG